MARGMFAVIAIGLDPLRILVLSQVVLSFALPFALVPLIMLTRRRDLMGDLVNRRLTFREYSTAAIFDPAVQAVIDKIDLIPDISVGVFGAEARVELADGRVYTSRQDCIQDFPAEEKLYTATSGLLPKRQAAAIVRAVDRIEGYANVRDFVRIAAGTGHRRR